MWFELWSAASGNLLADFATESEALAFVREAAEAEGREYAAGFVLAHENSRGQTRTVAEGEALLRRAQQAADTAPPPSRAASA